MKMFLAAVATLIAASSAMAESIVIEDAYARVGRPGAPSGAIFMVIRNTGETADRLIAAASPVAQRVELHTHIDDRGVMKMRPIEGGIEIGGDQSHALERGGDHVMLMGLTEKLENGMTVDLTLTFEVAGEVETTVTVDNMRGQGGHGN